MTWSHFVVEKSNHQQTIDSPLEDLHTDGCSLLGKTSSTTMIESVIIVSEEDTAKRHCWRTAIAILYYNNNNRFSSGDYRLQGVTIVVRDISRVCLSVCACLVWGGFTFDPIASSGHGARAKAERTSTWIGAAAPLGNIGNALRAEHRLMREQLSPVRRPVFIFNLSWPVRFVSVWQMR